MKTSYKYDNKYYSVYDMTSALFPQSIPTNAAQLIMKSAVAEYNTVSKTWDYYFCFTF